MKSILVTYPDFRSLPKGIKRMLLTSESLFFEMAKPAPDPCVTGVERVTSSSNEDLRNWAQVWAPPERTATDSSAVIWRASGLAGY